MKNNKSKVIASLGIMFVFLTAIAQQPFKCATDEMMKKQFDLHPEIYKKFKERELKLIKEDAVNFESGYKNLAQKSSAIVYVIPVVFHILHAYGTENISDAQVFDAMNILNNDFRKLNADTAAIVPAFKNIAGDVSIEFRLAKLDPNGNCTNGITRHVDVETDWTGNGYNVAWPGNYLNIYVVRSMDNGAAGYTYLPGSVPDPYDAIVILSTYVGSIGSSSPNTARALTHEVGHWFNLEHVWGNTNQPGVSCGDDGVTDTPITKGYYSNCALTNCKICNLAVEENVQNYMEYSYCCKMFTAGQAARMRISASSSISSRDYLWSATNLANVGVAPIAGACAAIADFSANKISSCTNSPIKFFDLSWNGQPTSWSWSFPGATPSSSSDSFPIITYPLPGVYSVSYTVSNAFGSSATAKTAYITIYNAQATYNAAWQESFENASIPNADWTVTNTAGVDWEQTSVASFTGSHSMFLNNTLNSPSSSAEAISPSINIVSIPNPSFTFKLAYAQKNSNQIDFLKIYASVNCGQTWSLKYNKSGQALQTLGPGVYQNSAFSPTINQWRTETVSLGALGNNSIVLWKFIFLSDAFSLGNNIYIDDINLLGSVGLDNELENTLNFYIAPNPSYGYANINFNLNAKLPVKVDVMDLLGQKIETLANSTFAAGEYKLRIGEKVNYSPGIYLVNLQLGDKFFTSKLIIE